MCLKLIIPLLLVLLPSLLLADISILSVKSADGGFCTGHVIFNGSGEAGAFTAELFKITDNAVPSIATKNGITSTAYFTQLCEGNYKIIIEDQMGCSQELPFSITGCNEINFTCEGHPAPQIFPTSSCTITDGAIKFFSNGACFEGHTGELSYAWSNGDSGFWITDLAAGTYMLTVTDEKFCTKVVEFVVPGGMEPTIDGVVTPSCPGADNGEILLFAFPPTGTQGNFTFTWSNGQQGQGNSSELINLAAGTYQVTIADASGACPNIRSFEVETVSGDPNLSLALATDGVSCGNENTARVNLTITGGFPPVHLQTTSGTYQDLAQVYNVAPGEQTISITDFCGNETSETVLIEGLEPLDLGIHSLAQGFCNGNGGSIEIREYSGAICSFQWQLGDLSGQAAYNGNSEYSYVTISNIAIGHHQLEITDCNGCIYKFPFEVKGNFVNDPLPLSVNIAPENISCFPAFIKPAVSGGTAPYYYSWVKDGQPYSHAPFLESYNATVDDSQIGSYELIVTDACGASLQKTINYDCDCFPTVEFTIGSPCENPVHSISVKQIPGYNSSGILYDLEWKMDGGDPLFGSISWAPFQAVQTSGVTVLDDVAANTTVDLVVRDSRGCEYGLQHIVSSDNSDINTFPLFHPDENQHDLSVLRPEIVPSGNYFPVMTTCANVEICNGIVQEEITNSNANNLGYWTAQPGYLDNPCQSGGWLKCAQGTGANPAVDIFIPENYTSLYFQLSNGNCACLFPADLVADIPQNIYNSGDTNHPIYVEFACLQQEPEEPEIEIEIEWYEECIDLISYDDGCDIKVICVDEFGQSEILGWIDGPSIEPVIELSNGQCVAVRAVCNCETYIDNSGKELLCGCEQEILETTGTSTYDEVDYSCQDALLEGLQTYSSATTPCPPPPGISLRKSESDNAQNENRPLVKLYPNPFDDFFNINLRNLDTQLEHHLTVLDNLGRPIHNSQFIALNENFNMEIRFKKHLQPGLYHVVLESNKEFILSERIVKF